VPDLMKVDPDEEIDGASENLPASLKQLWW
jgi:hypothetical protein